ncbi:tRNA (uridine(34)/cytosine(34)/5-carboxymethylaminomethyluridine(34)-2'-O)-methyltransferase TrmL [Ureibacillus sp. FSL K6-8385]|uniref:Putative tRNA (cytidine(34)-2'-O)-methyltransferase n=1 Tax=Ureibacillus terrenus TaxID=118246 RepID=A0A540V221_9BACL|nr:tRNA (uridine(34)/cytosine(34)/5-carboxymethylaminomethyluridine(34)-2'-O)-methyltransferase TrmL [Ureibacillus terrenus]MED3661088.1 tRNA (uridine(34)/cytosine(34)/5-carboxymethylaminomethyluridine(34)-2'-O)-methyltransferase TrmL [Ureibacillus terrenus]MED3763377.1 tRNA (uridine(34)/cytosine(34)/5-carboxymethylaminomethyluridine(34)-2'-O)-methyltransferase TrmL [Ureibacillus terrenus]TQE90789.1 tRNA (uridine(34)/cytosine(34)/5-carboxymethylaminomethyluridine(34)-2'-O)-methyltransferase TrmL
MPLHIVLYQPEIPPNTGNIARTCAATNTTLHLIRPLGFSTDDKMLKRAGLDYWEHVNIVYHDSLDDFVEYAKDGELYLIETYNDQYYTDFDFSDRNKDIYFVFGKETKGLPKDFALKHRDRVLRIPQTDKVRSLNLSNAAAIVIYEALRQQNFPGLK